jgi:hypothetical protein
MLSRRKLLNSLGLGALFGVPVGLSLDAAGKERRRETVEPSVLTVRTGTDWAINTVVWDSQGRRVTPIIRCRLRLRQDGRADAELLLAGLSVCGLSLVQKAEDQVGWYCKLQNGQPVCLDEQGQPVPGVRVLAFEADANRQHRWLVGCVAEVEWTDSE